MTTGNILCATVKLERALQSDDWKDPISGFEVRDILNFLHHAEAAGSPEIRAACRRAYDLYEEACRVETF